MVINDNGVIVSATLEELRNIYNGCGFNEYMCFEKYLYNSRRSGMTITDDNNSHNKEKLKRQMDEFLD